MSSSFCAHFRSSLTRGKKKLSLILLVVAVVFEVGLSLAFRRDFDGSVTLGVESAQELSLNKLLGEKEALQLTYKVRNFCSKSYDRISRLSRPLWRLFAHILNAGVLTKVLLKYVSGGTIR